MVTVITIHGLLGFAFAVGILRAAGERRSQSLRWTGLVLILAGAISIWIHPFFPMSSRWMDAGFNDTMHATLTFIWGPIIFAAVALSAVAYRGWFRLFAIASLLAMMVFGVASGIAIQGIEQNDTPWAGAFERVNAYVLMAWLAVLAVTVMRRSLNRATSEQRGTEAPPPRVQLRPFGAQRREPLPSWNEHIRGFLSLVGRPIRRSLRKGDSEPMSLPPTPS